MLKDCKFGLSLDELIKQPKGFLVLRGSDGEGDGSSDSADSEANKGKEADKADKSGDGDDDKSKDKKAEPSAADKRIAALEEEKQRFYDQREEFKKQLKTANDKIKQLEKDGTPDDALKTANDELTKTNEKLLANNQKLMLENAFLKEAGFDWVDPDAALRLADLSTVEYDEDQNKAIGLNSALTKLAKDKPYLLKPKADKDEEKDDEGKKRRTGTPPRPGTQKAADKAAQEAKLRAKYPALRR